MSPSRFRRLIGAVKDQTSIGLAKSNLDVAIVKATRHEELPAKERYILEVLYLTCYTRAHIRASVSRLSRRLNKTRNWTVALKTLVLIQRLLSEGGPAYEQEIFFATRRGTRLLNVSNFSDSSSSKSWAYSVFVRTYAFYLNERLEYKLQGRRVRQILSRFGEEDQQETGGYQDRAPVRATVPLQEMKIGQLFLKLQHLHRLLERFLACRPIGRAKNNLVVSMALYSIVKESFQMYDEMTDIMAILTDRFMEVDVPDCVRIYEMFSRVRKQLEELNAFYGWCKNVGVGRSFEYPEVEQITQKKLDLMDEFIRDQMALAQRSRDTSGDLKNGSVQKSKDPPEETKKDMNSIKALPPPEGFAGSSSKEEKHKEENMKSLQIAVIEADLLNLGEDAVTTQEDHGDNLAMALFDGMGPSTSTSTSTSSCTALDDNTSDWESTLVQSVSRFSNQPTFSMGGGFDILLLNGMYEQGAAEARMNYGSTSSVAEMTAMVSLPAPPAAGGNGLPANMDPFAPSFRVAPPSYVQMYDIETKQGLLAQEKWMWQQYGQLGFSRLQVNPYNMGGHMRSN
ncbi:hypothetical protein SAY87_011453 [Trapa incisa]|uniref:ENTH domain-containing protein n=1 Tax=Trapa incisa TaxID=236973 RepID=A0AAN7GJA3_9MYRT|nr:hypothetical protein SAY87_011453 [Trapa incisa]